MKRVMRNCLIAVAVVLMTATMVSAMGEVPTDMKPIAVDVLTVKGCKVTPPTIEQIKEIAEDMSVPITINTIYVKTKGEAAEMKFYGSPTVRMNGLDMEPGMRGSRSYGIG